MSTVTNRLILLLGDRQQPIFWCWGDPADPEPQKQGELFLGDTLPDEIRDTRTTVLIPGYRVVLRHTQYHGPARLASAQTLIYQCEDELLEEVEDLHWVILGHEGINYFLVGYRRTDMQNWLSLLTQFGIKPAILLPDVLAFPYQRQPTTRFLRQYGLFRTGKYSGYCLPQHWPLEHIEAEHISFISMTAATETITLWQCALTEFDNNMTLLQREFASFLPWWRRSTWRKGMCGAGLLFTLVGLAIGGFGYQQQNAVIQQKIAALHHQFFGEKIPSQPLTAIQQQIALLQRWRQQPQFFELGQQLYQALPREYKNNFLTLTFSAEQAELTFTFPLVEVTPFSRLNEQGNQVSLQKVAGTDMALFTIRNAQ